MKKLSFWKNSGKERISNFLVRYGVSKEDAKLVKEPFMIGLSSDEIMNLLRYKNRKYMFIVIAILILQAICVSMLSSTHSNTVWIAVICIGLVAQFTLLVFFRLGMKREARKIISQVMGSKKI